MIIHKPLRGPRRLHAGHCPPTPPIKPEPTFDRGLYTEVTIAKSGDLNGHHYRFGAVYLVDADLLKALQSAGLVAPTAAA